MYSTGTGTGYDEPENAVYLQAAREPGRWNVLTARTDSILNDKPLTYHEAVQYCIDEGLLIVEPE